MSNQRNEELKIGVWNQKLKGKQLCALNLLLFII